MRRCVATLMGLCAASGCLTTWNRPKVTVRPDAPLLEPRAPGCNVEMVEDGKPLTRPHRDFADVTLKFSRDQLTGQGADGAMQTLREAACEQGAFFVHNLRAISIDSGDGGLVYEGTLATLVDGAGAPINAKAAVPPASPKPESGTVSP